MKLTNKQKEEIDFLSRKFGFRENPRDQRKPFEPTEKEIEEYINHTVKGIKTDNSNNRLLDAKWYWDITLKMYLEDMRGKPILGGLPTLLAKEVLEWWDHHPFVQRALPHWATY